MENQQEAFKFLMNQIKKLFNSEIKLTTNTTFQTTDHDKTFVVRSLINSYRHIANEYYLPKEFQAVINEIDLGVLTQHHNYITIAAKNYYTADLVYGSWREDLEDVMAKE